MSISDGVLANAANFNAAFESKNKSVVTKTTTYTATSSDYIILCNATSGSFTVTLPAAASNTGLILSFSRTDSTLANLVTIDGNASETIGGLTTRGLSTINEELHIISNGTNWDIISRYVPSIWTDYSPTIGGFTAGVGTVTGKWKRIGQDIVCQVYIPITGAVTGTTLTIPLPTGLTFGSTNMVSTGFINSAGTENLGGTIFDTSTSSYFFCSAMYNNSSSVFVVYIGSGTSGQYLGMSNTAPVTLANGDNITLRFGGPITNWGG